MATGYPAASGRAADPAPGADAPRVRTAVDSVRGQVKLVETSQAILFGLIVFGLAASLVIYVDAWLLPRQFETSLPDWMRWISLCSLLGWAIWYGLFRVAPLVFRRIHPEYAARLIEGDRPQYKNSLLNLLSLERDREHVPQEALRYLRAQAEQDLTKAPIEVVVSPRPAFFMACILVALVAIGAVATALAPDRMIAGTTRLAAPWSEVVPPARVEILAVRPGDVEVPLGSTVTIEAEIVRLAAKDAIAVVYSTDDGQFVDVRVPMEKAETPDTWKASLPEVGTDGLRRSLKYRVEAGDASSATFALKVAPQPTLVAEEVRYEYPAYTRLPARIERLPSTLRALEGTRATLSLSSNVKIGSARLDLYRAWPDFAGSVAPTVARTVTATSSERTAGAAFAVAMTADATKSEYAAVVPRMTGETGLVNDPLAIPIEAFRDLPPEVTWRAPLSDKIETPLNRSVELQFQALDPDFGLSKVEWFGLREESEIFRVPSLDSPQTSPAPRTFRVRFTPDIFGFKQGERARIAVDAWDGKTTIDGSPAYQRTRSTFIEVTILPPAPGEDPHAEKKPPAGNGDPDGDEGEQGSPGAGESAEGESGAGGGEGSSGSEGDSGSSGTDGTNSSSDEGEGQTEGSDSQSRSAGNSSGSGEEGEGSEGEGEPEGSADGSASNQNDSQNAGGESGMPSEGAGGASGENQMPSDPTQQPPGEGDPNAAPSDGEGNSEGAAGGSPSSGQTPNDKGGTPQGADGQPEQGQPSGEGGPQDPLHDGEAFEKILEKAQDPPSNGQPQQGQPQQGQTQQGQPQQGQPQQGQPQQGQPQQGQPQQGQPQQGQPQQGQPQQGQPQQGQPQQGQPQQGQPQQGQPQQGQPQQGQPQQGQPQQGQPQQGQPQQGQPQQGQPQQGQPQQGQPQQGQPQQGQPQQGSQEGSQPGASGESQGENQSGSQGGAQPGSQEPQPGSQGSGQPGSQGSGSSGQQGGSGSQPKGENQSGTSQSQKQEGDQGDAKQEQQGEKAMPENEQGEKEKGEAEEADGGQPEGGGEKGEGGAGDGQPGGEQSSQGGGAKKESKEGAGAAAGSKGDAGGASGGKPEQSGSKSDSAGGSMGGSSGPGSMGEGNDGATSGEGGVSPATTELPLPPGEKANLEYSKQATDLVLRYLDDEERRRDPALLKELGWGEAEMESFFAKWKAMKEAADALPEPGATTPSGEFEDAVRALGLRPRTSAQRSGTARDDSSVGDQVDGAVNQPPVEYLEQFRAFQRARNR